MKTKLYRNKSERIIAGVCSALADYLEIDVVFIRVFFLITALYWGTSVLIYIILWIIMPVDKGAVSDEASYVVRTSANPPIKSELDQKDKKKRAREILAVFLIVSGVFATLDNFLVWLTGKMWIPVVLITIGILILRNIRDNDE